MYTSVESLCLKRLHLSVFFSYQREAYYSLKGDDCYYNILTRNAHIIPIDLIFVETITVNGINYEVTLNSFFVTDELPQTIVVGETELTIGNLECD